MITLLKRSLKSNFTVHAITSKNATRSPAPPFETSTLQQEANRKFGMSIDSTMKTAQKLYEGGYITYMRTDSVSISDEGQAEIKKTIEDLYGKEYYQKTIYKQKSASAQLAHECCRPTHPHTESIEAEVSDAYQIKLYKLIWQRTIASQMKQAQIKVTTIQLSISKYVDNKLSPFYYPQSQIETVTFPGFMKVYIESVDDAEADDINRNFSGTLPKVGDTLTMIEMVAKQEYARPPPRYSEASLVKKLKDLGIGRPSTYVNTIKTIMDRTYVKIMDVAGIAKEVTTYTINTDNGIPVMRITEETDTINVGQEKKKICPTNLGVIVTNYLLEHFPEMLDYKFTAHMEAELDEIAAAKKVWYNVVQNFYDKLKPTVDKLSAQKNMIKSTEKLLGTDANGHEIFATKFSLKKKITDDKFLYANYQEPFTFENITLSDAIKLLEYPKILGTFEDTDIVLQKGPHGFYLIHNKENYGIQPNIKIDQIDLTAAIEIIKQKRANRIATFTVTKNGKKVVTIVLKGPYGFYIQATENKKKVNYPVPADIDPKDLTAEKVTEIISKKKTFAKNAKNAKNAKKKQAGG